MATPHAILDIDVGRIVGNYKTLQALAGATLVDAVVKADAYGLGVGIVAVALARAGVRQFYVATLDEGIGLRALLAMAGHDTPIAVLNGVSGGKDDVKALLEHGLTPVLNAPAQVALWAQHGRNAAAILQVNTGMNRAGVDRAALAEVKAKARFPLRLVMSHLACADTPEHPLHTAQKQAFAEVASLFPSVALSLAASSALLKDTATYYDRARIGAALYGAVPDARLKPVVRLRARVLEVRSVDRGAAVGYGASYRTQGSARLATLAYGYADGYPRHAGNRGYVMVAGYQAPIVGRVSMDLLTVDVSSVPESLCAAGTYAELLGEAVTVNTLADNADTIGYEILTRLGRRAERVYHDAAA